VTDHCTVITGANRGIGLELCRLYAAREERVVAAVRSSSTELDALGVEVVDGVDVTSDAQVDRLRDRLEPRSVSLLINNAGVYRPSSLEAIDFDQVRTQYEVNAVGPVRVTHRLLDRLQDGAKLAFITSRVGSIGDNSSGGSYGYRMSKAALNVAAVSFARDLRAREIAVAVLHPGAVRTKMNPVEGVIKPEVAARGLVARIDELTLAESGGFWHANGERLPW
jgi:NAD(P)-dependent dehydrogenase (short-subunit alcohol dehydrogenase family)